MLCQANAKAKFDETVDVRFALGTNPKRGDQMVRGALVLPHGTGKEPKVCVFARGTDAADARAAGGLALLPPARMARMANIVQCMALIGGTERALWVSRAPLAS